MLERLERRTPLHVERNDLAIDYTKRTARSRI